MRVKRLIALVAASVLLTAAAVAQDKPADIKIALATFLSGPASVFGVPGKAAAEMIAEDLNKRGGIAGVPVKLTFIDEGAEHPQRADAALRKSNGRLDRCDSHSYPGRRRNFPFWSRFRGLLFRTSSSRAIIADIPVVVNRARIRLASSLGQDVVSQRSAD
jgi:hypothetical protein